MHTHKVHMTTPTGWRFTIDRPESEVGEYVINIKKKSLTVDKIEHSPDCKCFKKGKK